MGEREKRDASELESVHGGGRMTGKGVGERGGRDVQALGLLCQLEKMIVEGCALVAGGAERKVRRVTRGGELYY